MTTPLASRIGLASKTFRSRVLVFGVVVLTVFGIGANVAAQGAGYVSTPHGVTFEDPTQNAGIDLAAAVAAVGGRRPDAWRYVLLTNPNVGPELVAGVGPDGIVKRPAYVLQYNNVSVPLYGPSVESAPDAVLSTVQVYVDAMTGTKLYAQAIGSLQP